MSGCARCANIGAQCTYLASSGASVRKRRRHLSGKSAGSATKRQTPSSPCPSPKVLDVDSSTKNELQLTSQESPNSTLLPPDFNDTQLHNGASTFGALLGESDDDVFSLFTDPNTMSTETSLEPLTPFSEPSPAISVPHRTDENNSEKKTCQCFQHVIFVLNEVEVMSSHYQDPGGCKGGIQFSQNTGALDSALQLHKKAIRHGASMRNCGRCFSRAENKILLSLLVKRLVALCTCMVSVASAQPSQLDGDPCPTLGVNIIAGEYEVDTGQETRAVFRELVAFQLSNLHSFVKSLAGLDQPLGVEFGTARNIACGLLWRLRQDNLLSVFESTALSQGL